MSKNIGAKRKKRASEIRQKMLLKQEAATTANKKKRKEELLAHKSRRRQSPIMRNNVMHQKLSCDETIPMSIERNIKIDNDNLLQNYQKLGEMEQEFVDQERLRQEYKEKMNGDPTEPFEDADRT